MCQKDTAMPRNRLGSHDGYVRPTTVVFSSVGRVFILWARQWLVERAEETGTGLGEAIRGRWHWKEFNRNVLQVIGCIMHRWKFEERLFNRADNQAASFVSWRFRRRKETSHDRSRRDLVRTLTEKNKREVDDVQGKAVDARARATSNPISRFGIFPPPLQCLVTSQTEDT